MWHVRTTFRIPNIRISITNFHVLHTKDQGSCAFSCGSMNLQSPWSLRTANLRLGSDITSWDSQQSQSQKLSFQRFDAKARLTDKTNLPDQPCMKRHDRPVKWWTLSPHLCCILPTCLAVTLRLNKLNQVDTIRTCCLLATVFLDGISPRSTISAAALLHFLPTCYWGLRWA